MKFHPAAQIMTWCLLVATMQALASIALLITAGLVLLAALVVSGQKFIQLLRRTRWIMLSLLLIYAYTTPGEPLLDAFGLISPSREGMVDGVLQLTRLLAALAGLAILLDRLHRQQLIAGLYTLFAPLQWLGMSRERLAVRLALTLHYAEVAMLRGTQTWQDALRATEDRGQRHPQVVRRGVPGSIAATLPQTEDSRPMELPVYRFAIADALLLSGAMLMLWLAMR